MKKVKYAPSEIHGTGVFAQEDIEENESVGPLIVGLKAGGLLGMNRTELGKYVNHQNDPNGRMEQVPGSPEDFYLRSLSPIVSGTDITMDYNDTPYFVAKPHDIDPEGYKDWK